MKKISLTKGQFALVDDEDYEYLNQFKWQVNKYSNGYRAIRQTYINKKEGHIYMHREIMHAPKNMEVDHIDHNALNNQKSNLRICTHIQNCRNYPKKKNYKYKGVSYCKRGRKIFFAARIQVMNKPIHIGYFKTEEEAASAYNDFARIYYKDFANYNILRKKKL